MSEERVKSQSIETEEQGGLRSERFCMDDIFTLQQVLEKRNARNISTHLVSKTLKKHKKQFV